MEKDIKINYSDQSRLIEAVCENKLEDSKYLDEMVVKFASVFFRNDFKDMQEFADTEEVKRINIALIRILNGDILAKKDSNKKDFIKNIKDREKYILQSWNIEELLFQTKSEKNYNLCIERLKLLSMYDGKLKKENINYTSDLCNVFLRVFYKYKEKGKEFWDNEAIKIFIEQYIEEKSQDKVFENEEKIFDFINKYIDNVTQKSNFNLFNEKCILYLMQLIRANKLPGEEVKYIKNILNKNLRYNIDEKGTLDNNPKDKADRLIKKLDKIETINTEQEMDLLIKKLQKIKLLELEDKKIKIPEEYIDIIITMSLSSESVINKNKEKYREFVERMLEEFAMNDKRIEYIKNSKGYFCFTRENIFGIDGAIRRTRGLSYSNVILLKKKENLDILRMLSVIFHENTHVVQSDRIFSYHIHNYLYYLMLKEQILMSEYIKFYDNNYNNIFEEIDAFSKSDEMMAKYLEKILDIEERQKRKIGDGNITIQDFIERTHKKKIIRKYKKSALDIEKVYKLGEYKKLKVNGKKHSIKKIFDRLIERYPDYLEIAPEIFKIEYDDLGHIRSPRDIILNGYEKINKKLLRDILCRENVFKKENIRKDEEELNKLIEEYQYDIDFTDFVRKIAKEKIPGFGLRTFLKRSKIVGMITEDKAKDENMYESDNSEEER